MAMTIREANALNTVPDYVMQWNDLVGAHHPTIGELCDALELLLGSANKTLGAGATAGDAPQIAAQLSHFLRSAG